MKVTLKTRIDGETVWVDLNFKNMTIPAVGDHFILNYKSSQYDLKIYAREFENAPFSNIQVTLYAEER